MDMVGRAAAPPMSVRIVRAKMMRDLREPERTEAIEAAENVIDARYIFEAKRRGIPAIRPVGMSDEGVLDD